LENGTLGLPDPELLPNNDNQNNTGVLRIYYIRRMERMVARPVALSHDVLHDLMSSRTMWSHDRATLACSRATLACSRATLA